MGRKPYSIAVFSILALLLSLATFLRQTDAVGTARRRLVKTVIGSTERPVGYFLSTIEVGRDSAGHRIRDSLDIAGRKQGFLALEATQPPKNTSQKQHRHRW